MIPKALAVRAFGGGGGGRSRVFICGYSSWPTRSWRRLQRGGARCRHAASASISIWRWVTSPDGSATWSAPDSYVQGATIGAPPDYFSTQGQDWGISALSPVGLERQDYAPFADLIADVDAPGRCAQ